MQVCYSQKQKDIRGHDFWLRVQSSVPLDEGFYFLILYMPVLVLVRHGKSVWNELGLWTGVVDVDLTDDGVREARTTGTLLSDISFHHLYTSNLYRAQRTLMELIEESGGNYHEATSDDALNERDYGDYTGKNKWQVKEMVGDDTFHRIRRSWDEPIPNGETLKDVHDRVVTYYESTIRPKLAEGKNVLIVAHGNSLRALAKHIENIPEENIAELEIGTGEAHCYTMDIDGTVWNKEVRGTQPAKGAV